MSEIQQKNLSALMKILSSIRYFARQRLPLRSQSGSKSNFCQLLPGMASQRNKPIYFNYHSKSNFK